MVSKKILIVDNEPNIVMALEYAFKKQGYVVFIARDGAEGLEILETHLPDVVLLDIMMPKVDGFQTLEAIKKNDKLSNLKVVFLSAKNKTSDIEKGLEAGVDKYLLKPFSVKKVIAEIDALLSN
ncbi:MAG: Response regulator [uncultured Aureispira sp.]|uniref:Response regulator n=1 Tax=uncultured Aureispira sp. TaxID=1331704 RepID=A0A6S6U9B6_9BACT|nr:MAG: Response regulator [uncultured Aureispira sp.]